MEGSCEYIKYAVPERGQGVVLQIWGLCEMLTTRHRKNVLCHEPFKKASDLNGYFVTTYATEKRHESWYVECEEPV